MRGVYPAPKVAGAYVLGVLKHADSELKCDCALVTTPIGQPAVGPSEGGSLALNPTTEGPERGGEGGAGGVPGS